MIYFNILLCPPPFFHTFKKPHIFHNYKFSKIMSFYFKYIII